MAREPRDSSRLLEDLESIRTLLDDEPTTSTKPLNATRLDIPLLQDIISSSNDAKTPALPTSDTTAKSQNPFLPYDSLARLAGERVHLERILNQQPPLGMATNQHTGAREVRMEARLHAEVQLILQDVIDEMLPVIEAQLRNRLNSKLEQIVREQLDQQVSDS